MAEPRIITDPHRAVQFALAGDARVTLRSRKTGHHYTYRVRKSGPVDGMAEGQPLWWVSVLTDRDQWVYLGRLRTDLPHLHQFTTSSRSKVERGSAAFAAFEFFWHRVGLRGVIPSDLEVRHEGRCGRCARPLTTPASIDLGIGPECATLLGLK